MGITLPKSSVPIENEPYRYRTRVSLQKAVKHLEQQLDANGGFRSFPAVVHSQVTAWYIVNTDPSRSWAGITISQIQGKVEIYIRPRRDNPRS